MRRAEERRSASMMISNSMRWSLAGNEVDWMTKQSAPRTFSWISTKTSMSAKRRTTALVSGVLRYSAICCAKAGLELPATSLIAPFLPDIPTSSSTLARWRRGHIKARRARQYGSKSLSPGQTLLAQCRQRHGMPGREGCRLARAAARQRHRAGIFNGGRGAFRALGRRRIGVGLEYPENPGGLGRGIAQAHKDHRRLAGRRGQVRRGI